MSNGSNYITLAQALSGLSFTAGSGAYNSSTGVISIPTNTNQLTNGAGFITGITSANVTTALGFTPYNATNPSGYITQAQARTSLSFTAGSGAYNNSTGVISIPTNTNQLTNGAGFITGINSSQVTTALGCTPYNATNPSGYITSSALTGYLPLSGGTLTGLLGGTSASFANIVESNSLNTGFNGLNVSGYGFLSQTLSGQMTVLGHNIRSSSSVANQVNVVNGGWLSSMIKMYYSDGITFHTSPSVYNAGSIYPMSNTERMKINIDGNIDISSLSASGNVIVSANNSGTLGKVTIGSGLSLTGGILTATGGSTGTVTGSGTAGRLAVWNSASDIGATTALTIAGSNLQVTGQLQAATGSYSGNVTASTFTGNGANLTGLTSSQVTSALGYTPYNSSNPNGYITSASVSGGTYTPTFVGTGATSITASGPTIYTKVGTVTTITGGVNFTASSLAGSIRLDDTYVKFLGAMQINGVATYTIGSGNVAYADVEEVVSMVSNSFHPKIVFNVGTYGSYTVKYVITIID